MSVDIAAGACCDEVGTGILGAVLVIKFTDCMITPRQADDNLIPN